jgi:Tol biopolymer transport system component
MYLILFLVNAEYSCIHLWQGLLLACIFLGLVSGTLIAGTPTFEGKIDVGKVNLPGSVQFNAAHDTIKMTGSGENIWGTQDAFYFIWNKVEGDISCKTGVVWEGKGKNLHRKAGWMIRAGLEPDDAYVDAVIHGDGLISMQYRKVKGDVTHEVQSPLRGPAVLHFERTGDQFTLSVSNGDGAIHPIGTISVYLTGKVYAGLVVCSHDSTVKETAIFSDASFNVHGVIADERKVVESTLETINIETGVRTIVHRAKQHFEAPNWSRDGNYFLYNSGGKIYTLSVSGGTPQLINTSFAMKCNNDHGISWDGKDLVISHHADDNKSLIYIVPITGGEPRLVTTKGPSYWHGISPDNKTLAYCAERNGEYDVYTISVNGGEEKRLTRTPGLDDGPEYSPDAQYIYFNSVRTGQMKIWRMKPDGSEQVQFTPTDEYGDWFAHPSPDNKWIVFISYDKSVEGHPANKNVVLRLMPTAGGEIKNIASLFGGQGTINVHSWSPDSKQCAFVSYRLVIP